MLNGLTQLNIELTSRCDKQTLCRFCGHQDPAVFPTLRFGDMTPKLLMSISDQVVELGQNLIVQFHRDGDPLAYKGTKRFTLGAALSIFGQNVRSIVTHGERLADRWMDIENNCESVTVSIFRGDPDREIQLASLREFISGQGWPLPKVFLKVVGDMSNDELAEYRALGVPIMHRRLHIPINNSKYAGGLPTMPEHGLCLDLLHHPSIAWDGRVYLCNRLDTKDAGLIGNLNTNSLDDIWNGELRASYIQKHLEGRRAEVPACASCTYYGIPAS